MTPCNLVGWCQIFGRICCLHFSTGSTEAGHGGQKPVGDGGSTKGQFVSGKVCTNSEEAESLKNFSGQIGKEKFREGSVNEKTGYCMCFQEGCYLGLSVILNLGNWPYRTSKPSCKPRNHVVGGV